MYEYPKCAISMFALATKKMPLDWKNNPEIKKII